MPPRSRWAQPFPRTGRVLHATNCESTKVQNSRRTHAAAPPTQCVSCISGVVSSQRGNVAQNHRACRSVCRNVCRCFGPHGPRRSRFMLHVASNRRCVLDRSERRLRHTARPCRRRAHLACLAVLGYGHSDPGAHSPQLARKPRALLRKSRTPAPHTLLGHSFGGYNLRVFTGLYRNEVSGIVLADSPHADHRTRPPLRSKRGPQNAVHSIVPRIWISGPWDRPNRPGPVAAAGRRP